MTSLLLWNRQNLHARWDFPGELRPTIVACSEAGLTTQARSHFAKTGSDRDSHDQNPDEILLRIINASQIGVVQILPPTAIVGSSIYPTHNA